MSGQFEFSGFFETCADRLMRGLDGIGSWLQARFCPGTLPFHLAMTGLYAVISLMVLAMHLQSPGLNTYERSLFRDMVQGEAHKPFVYRTLLPTLLRWTEALVPIETRQYLDEAIPSSPHAGKIMGELKLDWGHDGLTAYFIATLYLFGCLMAWAYAVRFLFNALYPNAPPWVSFMLPVVALLGLPPFFKDMQAELYDFPTLLLFTLGLVLMLRQRWVAFIGVYVLGCLNKETTILLSMIFFFYFLNPARMKRVQWFKLLFIQGCIFVGIKAGLSLVFADNPGSFVEFHLFRNAFKTPYYSLESWLSALFLLFLVVWSWPEKPLFLKFSLLIFIPLLILSFVLGNLFELRDYYELYPILFMLAVHSFLQVARRSSGSQAGTPA